MTLTQEQTDITRDIESRDPDGGTVEPTDDTRAAFRNWVITYYGLLWWTRYTERDLDTNLTWVQSHSRGFSTYE